MFSKLNWWVPGVWRCLLKICWGCYCCCWWWGIVLATVCCRLGSWGLVIKLNFCSDYEHKVWSRFWSWSSGEILKLKFSQYLVLILGWVYEDYSWSRFWSYVRSRFLNFSLVEMLIFGWGFEVAAWTRLWRWMKSYQDLFENLWYDLKKLLW